MSFEYTVQIRMYDITFNTGENAHTITQYRIKKIKSHDDVFTISTLQKQESIVFWWY